LALDRWAVAAELVDFCRGLSGDPAVWGDVYVRASRAT
jgi:hypothetical protein